MNWNELKRERIYIDGQWCGADGGGEITVSDPASGEAIGTVPDAGAVETRRAIEAAQAALGEWGARPAAERAVFLRDLSAAILDHQDALAELLTREQGKPLAEARGEVGMSASYILWFAEEARRAYGDVIPSPWRDRQILVTKEPIGVVGAITPWNFPSSMLARKIGPALAAGCTVVAKPASQTPYSGLAWALLAEMVGIPAGVLNVVTGSPRAIGGELTANPLVKKITFTGSTQVGKTLLAQGAGTVKKMSMELGGNAPFIVFDDADLDRAVEGAIAAKFRNAGQTCVCTNRFYAQSGIHDAFVEKLAAATSALRVGSGLEAGTVIGPLIDGHAVAKAETMVADATARGGRIVVGGGRDERGDSFFQPTVIADATDDMTLAREEIFGPVAPVFRFQTEDEVIARANATEFGLACYFYTRDLGRTFRVSKRLQCGIVGVNEGIVTTEVAPFGGVKESGFGSEGSKYGLGDYMNVKYTCIGGLGL
ncbi:NAD-dependent succinate-semialdehyde dehydrogenase [Aquamicrobium sp. LC103]|uniref:NAD-dependent succinate-semialdehyde dehydrogenase n=1 Tax=Aquamicrobium sp. LC103 TaxID=1120658 RepID=UPI00063E7D90|nr:NAD-dependent succinate-semialdehyde dehydrogenase [Aquamicrobium sp. LC103]TKT69817.1 NAD-dependent succinate-semialdehyde dehydrogenase [Aquamicrobium sp. LC103]